MPRQPFQFCVKRNRARKLTMAAKTNVLNYASDLWMRVFQELAKEYPQVKTDYTHIDALCMWMVKNPEWYDVVVTDIRMPGADGFRVLEAVKSTSPVIGVLAGSPSPPGLPRRTSAPIAFRA